MSKLISGKEALIALANGEEVEFQREDSGNWKNAMTLNLFSFNSSLFKFRLKPRTITINGIEVPGVKYVAHSGGNCVKISCECPEDAAAIGAALRSIFNP